MNGPDTTMNGANAAIHLDDAITGWRMMRGAFDDRIVVTSPGALTRHATVDRARKRGAPSSRNSPWRKSPLHSSGDAPRLTALLLGQICPIFSLVAPCQAGASPLSVRRGVSPRAGKEMAYHGESISAAL